MCVTLEVYLVFFLIYVNDFVTSPCETSDPVGIVFKCTV